MPPLLNRLTLYVRNTETVAEFYCRYFGYSAVHADGGLIELTASTGGCDLLLHPLAKSRKAGQTLVKLVFQVVDVEAEKLAFAERGLDFGPTHKGDGYQFANAKDPAGNAISISNRIFART
ncbi:VOC family protein [Roseibium denhamense]|uniref:Glyoxalase/Bleomycin resistance protein/Dioxygenase superfamily protein n=1 Tax=Roseibium denhamense TaxID=76305 RepID=A0ABY1NVR8_9HYPH|nr:VOC family protein [Roseibium denhamense]MTI04435.1 VOC family protein [Roseibium denhamense]SMP19650.1 Glyoxalase/Bleomycin resistance protein/Dioxygenase superfamily protein [Roseibium denhamense]